MKRHSKLIITSFFLLLFILPVFFNRFPDDLADQPTNLQTSSDPVLYANNNYDFNLDNYYDDADLDHVYTDANFQKTYVPTMIQYNESVSYVNNSESQTPHYTDVSMTKGEFDDTDYMHIDDNAYSVFTSDGGTTTDYDYDSPSQWGEFGFTKGSGTTAQDILSNNDVYSTLTSGITNNYDYDSPAQWGEFGFTKGSGTTAQDIIYNNGVYSTLTSGITNNYDYDSPAQWGEFGFTKGSGTTAQDILSNNDVYSTLTSGITNNYAYDSPAQWGEFSFTKGFGTTALDILSNNGVYSTLTSGITSNYAYDSPSQWGEFSFTKGSGTTAQDILTNNGVYSTLTSGSTTSYNYDYDSPSQWSEFAFTKGSGTTAQDIISNNGVYSTLTSSPYSPASDGDPNYINSVTYNAGSYYDGTLLNTQTDDGAYYRSTKRPYEIFDMNLFFDPALTGHDVELSINVIGGGQSIYLYINGVAVVGGASLDFDNQVYENVNTVELREAYSTSSRYIVLYYFKIIELDLIPEEPAEFDYTVEWTIPTGTPQTLYYDYMTSVAVDCDMDIYDWVSTSYVELQSNTGTSWITNSYNLASNPNKVSGTNQVRVRFQTAGYSSNFYMYIDQLAVYYQIPITTYSFDYSMTWIFPSGTAQTLYYDYKTSVAVKMDLDIYDWVSTTWVELRTATTTAWQTSTYDLVANPNKVSGSNQVRVRFQSSAYASSFLHYIDQLTTYYNTPTYSFDYSMTWIFPSGTAQTLYYDYATSVAVKMDLDIYDWVSTTWVELRTATTTAWQTGTYDLVANPNKVSGSNQVRVRFQSSAYASSFLHYIDQLAVYYNTPTYSFDYSMTWIFPSGTAQTLYYDYATSVAVKMDLDIYDWVSTEWTELRTATTTGWQTSTYNLATNPNKVSGSRQVRVRFQSGAYASNFLHYIDQLTTYYNTPTYSFDYEVSWAVPTGNPLTLYYDYATSVSVDCDLDIWDYVAGGGSWVELQSNTGTGYITSNYDLSANPNKVSGGNTIKIRFQTASYSSNFYMYIDQLTTYYNTPTYSFDYEISWAVPSGSPLTLYYDYRTSVSVDCDLDIWDYVATSWLELQSNTGTSWITNSYDLVANPNKVSGGNTIKIRFQTASYSSNFYMYIDQLTMYYQVITPNDAELDFTVQSPVFSNYLRDDKIALKITSNHFTSLSTATTTKIWNDETSTWVQLWSATRTSEYQETYTITSNVNQYFDGSGNVKLQYITYHASTIHTLSIDYVEFLLVDKLDLIHTTSFDKLGQWNVRWEILGSIYYTAWVSYEVISYPPNFEGISESDYTTRWILQNATTVPVEDFHDDIDTDYWDLVDVASEVFDYSVACTGDSYVSSGLGNVDSNYGSDWYMYVGNPYASTQSYVSFVDSSNYQKLNQTGANTVAVRSITETDSTVECYNTSSFNEATITWNNKPAIEDYQDENLIDTVYKWYYWDTSIYYSTYYMFLVTGFSLNVGLFTKEYSTSNDPYMIRTGMSKNYFGDDYMYMQTNILESIGLKSVDYGFHYTLASGDYYEIDCQTNSDSQINLILYKDGVVQKTLVVSPSGNTNFNRRTVKVVASENLEFDQLKIQSTFDDKDYVKIHDVKTYKYTPVGDYANMLVVSHGVKGIYLTPDEYNIRVYELIGGGEYERINQNITIPETGQLQWVYVPTITQQSKVRLLTMDNTPLTFSDYNVYVNRSLDGSYDIVPLYTDIFEVDQGTFIYFDIYDKFGSLIISNEEKQVSDFININLEVYLLQLKNLMEIQTTISINGSYIYPLLSGNIIEFMLASRYYQIFFYDEYGVNRDFITLLDQNKAFQLNSSLKTIYFSMFTYDGLGINHDFVRFYINDAIKSLGFNSMLEDTLELVILDFFGNELANETIDANAYDNSEYNLFIEIYSLIILNQFTYEDIIVNITQVDSGVWMTQVIPKQFGLTYRFLPNIEYNITIYFINTTLYSSRVVNLTDNSHIESFGVATTTPEYPKNVYFSIYTNVGLAIDHNLLKFYIEGDRADFGFNTIEDQIVSIIVIDFLNTTLFNQMINTSGIYEYDILINLYSLKLISKSQELVNYSLSLGSSTIESVIFPNEIIEYQLATNTYVFNFTNQEDFSFHSLTIVLNESKNYMINTTYYEIYLGLYNFYGVVNRDEVKFYINDTRTDFGFNTIKSDYADLLVLDYFNSTLYHEIVKLSGLKEYSIFICAYTLIINNEYNTQSIIVKITRGTISIERFIEAQGYAELKLFPNIVYELISYVNGTIDEEKDADLDEEYKTVNFGFYETTVPVNPIPLINSINLLFWFGIFVFFILFIIIILYVRFKKDTASIPFEVKSIIKKNRRKLNDKDKPYYKNKDIYID